MSETNDFLTLVLDKIEKSLQQKKQEISDVEQDIKQMNDYYWENYTEMDQYGYENYDNQQALHLQLSTNEQNQKDLRRLKKMKDSPFFGSVTFRYEDDEEDDLPETFYIGIGNFSDGPGTTPYILDWRAPICSLFYDYDKGAASYTAPGGVMDGEILSKNQYKIRKGELIYEFESDIKIDDDILKEELSTNSDVKLKNIVRTIQKEQNAIIRNTKDRVLIIQGVAGSGKTSVALHRIAYLLYHNRKTLSSSNVLILSPNSVFSDYISQILPELGEENIQEMSLDLFAYHELKDIVEDCEDRYDQIERQMRISDPENEELKRYEWKQSKQMLRAMEGFLIDLEDRLIDFKDISFGGNTITADEIRTLFYQKFMDRPLLSRMDDICDHFVDACETLRKKDLNEEELSNVKERFAKCYVTKDIYVLYSWFLKEQGYPELPHRGHDNRFLKYEDVFPMFYLKSRLTASRKRQQIRHLVIDEMQDYSYLQYLILNTLFPCPKTILGDRAQTLDNHEHDVLRFLPKLVGRDGTRTIIMNKSYRNTMEISAYAQSLSNIFDLSYLERHGKDVISQTVSSRSDAITNVLSHLNLGLRAFETAAILVPTEEEAKQVYEFLKQKEISASYIDRNSSSFSKGLIVTTWYLAKGLEFDQVFVLGRLKDEGFDRQFRFIGATRALHELYLYSYDL